MVELVWVDVDNEIYDECPNGETYVSNDVVSDAEGQDGLLTIQMLLLFYQIFNFYGCGVDITKNVHYKYVIF